MVVEPEARCWPIDILKARGWDYTIATAISLVAGWRSIAPCNDLNGYYCAHSVAPKPQLMRIPILSLGTIYIYIKITKLILI